MRVVIRNVRQNGRPRRRDLPGRHLKPFLDPGELTNLPFPHEISSSVRPRLADGGGSSASHVRFLRRLLGFQVFRLVRRVDFGALAAVVGKVSAAIFPPLFEPSVFIFPGDLRLTFQAGSGILQAVIGLCPQAVMPHCLC